MKIEIPIGARGSRDEFSSTYKDDFLIKKWIGSYQNRLYRI
ncbi:hypothetical protein [Lactobacillus johnsonii]|nr:hypothetical protein [Lactobacillus johnsonii]